MTPKQIKEIISSKIHPGNIIKVQKRSSDGYKLLGYITVKVIAIYDSFTLTERNGYRTCYQNSDIIKCI